MQARASGWQFRALQFEGTEEYEGCRSLIAAGGMGDCACRRRTAAIGRCARRGCARRHSGRVVRARACDPCSSGSASGRRVTLFVAPSLLPFSEVSAVLCLRLILLIPFAGAGLALINSGLGRSRSAAHAMVGALCVTAVAAVVYAIVGFAWQGMAGRRDHALVVAGKAWGWIAAEPFFLRGLRLDLSPAALVVLLQMFSVGLAGMIPLSSGADRWRLGAICASTALLAGWTYPLFAHWVWGGGWLAQLGANCGLGYGFLDAGGAGVIQAVGGLTALSIALILGPRRGKYSAAGMPAAIPGHNAVLVLFACFLTRSEERRVGKECRSRW